MLEVVALSEARESIIKRFDTRPFAQEECSITESCGRVLARDLVAVEGVPAFNRSTVDGYAVIADDTFGCSDALPALLSLTGEVEMGASFDQDCAAGSCIRIPTGGEVPQGADAVVMLEYCEDYGDGTIGIARPVAPGDNIVFKNDDIKPGEILIEASTKLKAHHVGTFASLGILTCEVYRPLSVGIISTGDEIIPIDQIPVASQMRDVNAPVLSADLQSLGAQVITFDIVPDEYDILLSRVKEALSLCDVVLISGGSSAGQKDNTARILKELGTMLFHGVAVKPGKPTMCADVDGKPVFGLPGHPVAAYFMYLELVRPLLASWHVLGVAQRKISAQLASGIPSNHGRSELVAVSLKRDEQGWRAVPIHGKSGLISQLSKADGYLEIDRNQEGLAAGSTVEIRLFD